MNWRHLQAFLWLRWRLMANQWRRAGVVNAVLMTIVMVGAVLTAIPLLIGSFIAGLYLIPRAAPIHLMYAWDALVVAFLFFWTIGLITELQRNEPLALSKFLHLPVSVNGAFLINYLSSLLRLSLIFFVPLMLGFALSLVYTQGISQLPVLVSLAAFLLMVTALTYQLQGWLAALMSNPRRRRTVIVVLTAGFVLVAQLPNLLNFVAPWGSQRVIERNQAFAKALAKQNAASEADLTNLKLDLESHRIDSTAYVHQMQEIMEKRKQIAEKSKLDAQKADEATFQQTHRIARIANQVLPIGWLPLGVMSAAEGSVLPSILGLLGMTLIGTASLWRAYRTTIGL